MKTKTIPFDLETAKKIQAGEIEGAIKTREGLPVRLLCTDVKGQQCVVTATLYKDGSEVVDLYGVRGNFSPSGAYSEHDLVLEVPDTEQEFRPFDKVLVRDDDSGEWCLDLYAYRVKPRFHRMVGGSYWKQCIPYDGNESLLGITDKPKED